MPDITNFLNAQQDQTKRKNWVIVHETPGSRYYMILFPCNDNFVLTFAYEWINFEGMWLAGGRYGEPRREITNDDLQFWYDAQRDVGDW